MDLKIFLVLILISLSLDIQVAKGQSLGFLDWLPFSAQYFQDKLNDFKSSPVIERVKRYVSIPIWKRNFKKYIVEEAPNPKAASYKNWTPVKFVPILRVKEGANGTSNSNTTLATNSKSDSNTTKVESQSNVQPKKDERVELSSPPSA